MTDKGNFVLSYKALLCQPAGAIHSSHVFLQIAVALLIRPQLYKSLIKAQKQNCAGAIQTVPILRQRRNQHFREIWLQGAEN